MRNPGASGANLTLTVQELPAEMVPVQVLPIPGVKSRPATPCVTTWTELIVVVAAKLKFTGWVLLQGAGVACPDGQTLTLPNLCGAKAKPISSFCSMLPPVPAVKPM